jgi:hypothetical protein
MAFGVMRWRSITDARSRVTAKAPPEGINMDVEPVFGDIDADENRTTAEC